MNKTSCEIHAIQNDFLFVFQKTTSHIYMLSVIMFLLNYFNLKTDNT